jgi:iron only hydrogenase large subunit-like protein
MLGTLAKTYYAKKQGIPRKNIAVVSVMPCTAKKFESTRPELKSGVDYVLTTREASKLIKYLEKKLILQIGNHSHTITLPILKGMFYVIMKT